ncbi:MAG: T9SS type A sorting domain-containing protein [Lewinellaceae bacterium]|nr:T9SS type A sorting domain-containing protein [Saprospiraceae bacterium]MCB9337159.1 T9SS type A sorting domain-containing protein [Lewinellaceae bacterium]
MKMAPKKAADFCPSILVMKRFSIALLLLLAVPFLPITKAQGWQLKPGFNNYDFARGAFPTPDGGYIVAGHTGLNNDLHDAYLLKLDPFGREQWRKVFGGPMHDEIDGFYQTSDGGYIIAGSTFNGSNNDIWLVKTDRLGNIEWQNTYGNAAFEFGRAVIQTSDGGYAVVGRSDNGSDIGIFLLKTDGAGSQEWYNIYGGTEEDEGWGLAETPGQQIVFVGATASFGAGAKDIYLAKVNLNGDFQWFQTFGGADEELAFSVIPTSDGHLLIGGATRSFGAGDFDVYLVKASNDGVLQWSKTYGGAFGEWGAFVKEVPSGGYALVGTAQSFNNFFDDIYLIRTDNDGNELWYNTFLQDKKDVPHSLELTPDDGFIIAGHSRVDTNGIVETSQSLVMRMDASGNLLSNYLQGRIFHDLNGNCAFDSGEPGFGGWMLRASNPNQTFYGLTDSDGNYSILTDTGSFTLQLIPPNSYWQPCENNLSQVFVSTFDTLVASFPLQAAYDCPQLEVDAATSIIQPCKSAIYDVRYCNHGTVDAQGTYVEITLDPSLAFVSATLPSTSQPGNTWRFDIGNLAPGECGGFALKTFLACNVDLGRTHGVKAHIFPDSICLPPAPQWDGSSLEVKGNCQGDSVQFLVKNKGTGGMDEPQALIVIEDQIVGRALQIQLPAGDSLVFKQPAFGKTIRLETEQAEGHPGRSRPSVAVEGCSQSGGNVSLGYVTMFPEDDADAFQSIDKRESAAYLPPDAKLAFPKGIDSLHLIKRETDIEYLIHFKNTSGDTASAVVIQDTLSHWLDLTTLRPGSASHPYQMALSNTGILQFTFDNIQLPDSLTNDSAAHGFVKFRVSQLPNVPVDSQILNRSCVTFDYSSPHAKPSYFHTIKKPEVISISDVSLCTGGLYQGVAYQGDTAFLQSIALPLVDSLNYTQITAWPVYDLSFQDSTCANVPYFFSGQWLSAPGLYQDTTLVTTLGCDSLVTVDLSTIPLPEITLDTAIAIGSVFLGRQLNSDTVVVDTVFSEMGCDTVVRWVVDVYTGSQDLFEKTLNLSVFPNPTSSDFTIEMDLPEAMEMSMEVVDILGRRVAILAENIVFQKGKQRITIDTGDWPSGIYSLRFQTGGRSFSKKIIKQ